MTVTELASYTDSLWTSPKKPTQKLNIVIPVFNETDVLTTLFSRLEKVVSDLDLKTEVILVDDGSDDSTWLDICDYSAKSFDLLCINLSRNFGKEAALTAGLKTVTGQVVVILDADCQDPPELIPQMLDAWQAGAEVVNMMRRSRTGESWLKRKTAALYYRILGKLSDTPIPENVGDFRLLSRCVVDEVNRLGERNRYMKGILSWPGFRQETINYDREARVAGNTKWNYWGLAYLAVSGITAFSNKPLRLANWLGVTIALSSLIYAVIVFIRTLMFGDPVSGYPSLMIVIAFIGGVQLITIGILGEYIGRIFTEVKNRPNYIIRESLSKDAVVDASRLHKLRDEGHA